MTRTNVFGWILDEAEEQIGESCVGEACGNYDFPSGISCTSSVATQRADDSDQTIDTIDSTNDHDSTTSFTTSGYSSEGANNLLSREYMRQETQKLQQQILLQEQRLLQQNQENRDDDDDDEQEEEPDLENIGVTASGSYYFTSLNDVVYPFHQSVSHRSSSDTSTEHDDKKGMMETRTDTNHRLSTVVEADRDDTENSIHEGDNPETLRQPITEHQDDDDDIETGILCGGAAGVCAVPSAAAAIGDEVNSIRNSDETDPGVIENEELQEEILTILNVAGEDIDEGDDDLDEIIGFDDDDKPRKQKPNGRKKLFWYAIIIGFVVVGASVGATLGILMTRKKKANEDENNKSETPGSNSTTTIQDAPIVGRLDPVSEATTVPNIDSKMSQGETDEASEEEVDDFIMIDDGALDFHDDLLVKHLEAFEEWRESSRIGDDDDSENQEGDNVFDIDDDWNFDFDDDLLEVRF